MLNETKIINYLKQNFISPGGIGDDAAIITGSNLISKDLLVEDIHFRLKYTDAASLAHKALQVNLSDIAAMGGLPSHVLLGIALPQNAQEYIDEFLQSFVQSCHQNNVELIGGDTCASPDKLYISVTIIGTAHTPILRSTAKIGDIVCAVGNLGYAHLGLQALESNTDIPKEFKQAFLKPNAAIKESLWLSSQASVTAMMDISDGLLTDLKKLCFASGVAAEINIDNLKNNIIFEESCSALNLNPLEVILTGGEDYGLLFTVKNDTYQELQANANFLIKRIGKIIKGNKGEVAFSRNIDLSLKEFSHFGEL
jgi:thiamine-monophosphate kinase